MGQHIQTGYSEMGGGGVGKKEQNKDKGEQTSAVLPSLRVTWEAPN